jgi:hypothetical protein
VTDPNRSKGEKLCQSCGMCCEGVFHSSAHIYEDQDLVIANRIGATILEDPADPADPADTQSRVFSLPCPAFDGKCSVYPDRPSVCGDHHCDVLKSLLTDEVTPAEALDKVSSLKAILANILPTLHMLSGNAMSNRPETLMYDILKELPTEQARAGFKKEHAELLVQFGAFKFMRESTFYRKRCRMDSQ